MQAEKVTEVLALTTFGAAVALLAAFVSAIITANGWTGGVYATVKRNDGIAISTSKDDYDLRTTDPVQDNGAASPNPSSLLPP